MSVLQRTQVSAALSSMSVLSIPVSLLHVCAGDLGKRKRKRKQKETADPEDDSAEPIDHSMLSVQKPLS